MWSWFKRLPGSICYVIGEDTLLSQCLSTQEHKWVLVNIVRATQQNGYGLAFTYSNKSRVKTTTTTTNFVHKKFLTGCSWCCIWMYGWCVNQLPPCAAASWYAKGMFVCTKVAPCFKDQHTISITFTSCLTVWSLVSSEGLFQIYKW